MATYHGQTVDLLQEWEGSYVPSGWTEDDSNGVLSADAAAKYEGTYGLKYESTGSYAATIEVHAGENKSAMSCGFWFYMPTYAESSGYVAHACLADNGIANYTVRFYTGRDAGDNVPACKLRNAAGDFSSRIALSESTWYWVTIKATYGGNILLQVYDTNGDQVGSEVSVACGNYYLEAFFCGSWEATFPTSDVYFDSIVLDWTTAAFPLVGWETATAQFARPAADRTDGSWLNSAGTPDNVALYSYIDETSYSDSDYIRSSASPSSDTCVIDLSSIATPQAGTVTLRVRAKHT